MAKYKMLMIKCGGYTALVNLHQVFCMFENFHNKILGKIYEGYFKNVFTVCPHTFIYNSGFFFFHLFLLVGG